MGLKNNKALGQHWLKNREILDKIADLSGGGKVCLEIGPGLGTLTSSLLKHFDKVIAVEYDKGLADNLPKSFPGKNLDVINADILSLDLDFIKEQYVAVGNIPYYITSPIIEKLLVLDNKPERIVLLIQKEVAERISDKKETILSLFVKNHADIELGPVVLREEFTPPPKVDSQIIILKPHTQIVPDVVFDLIRKGFSAPRKKLIHNLASLKSGDEIIRAFNELGIDLNVRPGDLTLTDWEKIYQSI